MDPSGPLRRPRTGNNASDLRTNHHLAAAHCQVATWMVVERRPVDLASSCVDVPGSTL